MRAAVRGRRLASVAGASVALFARVARDAGADRLSAADHAQRDRRDPRRVDQLDDHAHAAGAQLDPRGRPSRGAGRPELLGTTREFLDYFGLKSLDQLPTLAELKDVETIGVQLELPGGDADSEPEAEAEAGADALDAAAQEPEAQGEDAANGEEEEDPDSSATLVAAEE